MEHVRFSKLRLSYNMCFRTTQRMEQMHEEINKWNGEARVWNRHIQTVIET